MKDLINLRMSRVERNLKPNLPNNRLQARTPGVYAPSVMPTPQERMRTIEERNLRLRDQKTMYSLLDPILNVAARDRVSRDSPFHGSVFEPITTTVYGYADIMKRMFNITDPAEMLNTTFRFLGDTLDTVALITTKPLVHSQTTTDSFSESFREGLGLGSRGREARYFEQLNQNIDWLPENTFTNLLGEVLIDPMNWVTLFSVAGPSTMASLGGAKTKSATYMTKYSKKAEILADTTMSASRKRSLINQYDNELRELAKSLNRTTPVEIIELVGDPAAKHNWGKIRRLSNYLWRSDEKGFTTAVSRFASEGSLRKTVNYTQASQVYRQAKNAMPTRIGYDIMRVLDDFESAYIRQLRGVTPFAAIRHTKSLYKNLKGISPNQANKMLGEIKHITDIKNMDKIDLSDLQQQYKALGATINDSRHMKTLNNDEVQELFDKYNTVKSNLALKRGLEKTKVAQDNVKELQSKIEANQEDLNQHVKNNNLDNINNESIEDLYEEYSSITAEKMRKGGDLKDDRERYLYRLFHDDKGPGEKYRELKDFLNRNQQEHHRAVMQSDSMPKIVERIKSIDTRYKAMQKRGQSITSSFADIEKLQERMNIFSKNNPNEAIPQELYDEFVLLTQLQEVLESTSYMKELRDYVISSLSSPALRSFRQGMTQALRKSKDIYTKQIASYESAFKNMELLKSNDMRFNIASVGEVSLNKDMDFIESHFNALYKKLELADLFTEYKGTHKAFLQDSFKKLADDFRAEKSVVADEKTLGGFVDELEVLLEDTKNLQRTDPSNDEYDKVMEKFFKFLNEDLADAFNGATPKTFRTINSTLKTLQDISQTTPSGKSRSASLVKRFRRVQESFSKNTDLIRPRQESLSNVKRFAEARKSPSKSNRFTRAQKPLSKSKRIRRGQKLPSKNTDLVITDDKDFLDVASTLGRLAKKMNALEKPKGEEVFSIEKLREEALALGKSNNYFNTYILPLVDSKSKSSLRIFYNDLLGGSDIVTKLSRSGSDELMNYSKILQHYFQGNPFYLEVFRLDLLSERINSILSTHSHYFTKQLRDSMSNASNILNEIQTHMASFKVQHSLSNKKNLAKFKMELIERQQKIFKNSFDGSKKNMFIHLNSKGGEMDYQVLKAQINKLKLDTPASEVKAAADRIMRIYKKYRNTFNNLRYSKGRGGMIDSQIRSYDSRIRHLKGMYEQLNTVKEVNQEDLLSVLMEDPSLDAHLEYAIDNVLSTFNRKVNNTNFFDNINKLLDDRNVQHAFAIEELIDSSRKSAGKHRSFLDVGTKKFYDTLHSTIDPVLKDLGYDKPVTNENILQLYYQVHKRVLEDISNHFEQFNRFTHHNMLNIHSSAQHAAFFNAVPEYLSSTKKSAFKHVPSDKFNLAKRAETIKLKEEAMMKSSKSFSVQHDDIFNYYRAQPSRNKGKFSSNDLDRKLSNLKSKKNRTSVDNEVIEYLEEVKDFREQVNFIVKNYPDSSDVMPVMEARQIKKIWATNNEFYYSISDADFAKNMKETFRMDDKAYRQLIQEVADIKAGKSLDSYSEALPSLIGAMVYKQDFEALFSKVKKWSTLYSTFRSTEIDKLLSHIKGITRNVLKNVELTTTAGKINISKIHIDIRRKYAHIRKPEHILSKYLADEFKHAMTGFQTHISGVKKLMKSHRMPRSMSTGGKDYGVFDRILSVKNDGLSTTSNYFDPELSKLTSNIEPDSGFEFVTRSDGSRYTKPLDLFETDPNKGAVNKISIDFETKSYRDNDGIEQVVPWQIGYTKRNMKNEIVETRNFFVRLEGSAAPDDASLKFSKVTREDYLKNADTTLEEAKEMLLHAGINEEDTAILAYFSKHERTALESMGLKNVAAPVVDTSPLVRMYTHHRYQNLSAMSSHERLRRGLEEEFKALQNIGTGKLEDHAYNLLGGDKGSQRIQSLLQQDGIAGQQIDSHNALFDVAVMDELVFNMPADQSVQKILNDSLGTTNLTRLNNMEAMSFTVDEIQQINDFLPNFEQLDGLTKKLDTELSTVPNSAEAGLLLEHLNLVDDIKDLKLKISSGDLKPGELSFEDINKLNSAMEDFIEYYESYHFKDLVAKGDQISKSPFTGADPYQLVNKMKNAQQVADRTPKGANPYLDSVRHFIQRDNQLAEYSDQSFDEAFSRLQILNKMPIDAKNRQGIDADQVRVAYDYLNAIKDFRSGSDKFMSSEVSTANNLRWSLSDAGEFLSKDKEFTRMQQTGSGAIVLGVDTPIKNQYAAHNIDVRTKIPMMDEYLRLNSIINNVKKREDTLATAVYGDAAGYITPSNEFNRLEILSSLKNNEDYFTLLDVLEGNVSEVDSALYDSALFSRDIITSTVKRLGKYDDDMFNNKFRNKKGALDYTQVKSEFMKLAPANSRIKQFMQYKRDLRHSMDFLSDYYGFVDTLLEGASMKETQDIRVMSANFVSYMGEVERKFKDRMAQEVIDRSDEPIENIVTEILSEVKADPEFTKFVTSPHLKKMFSEEQQETIISSFRSLVSSRAHSLIDIPINNTSSGKRAYRLFVVPDTGDTNELYHGFKDLMIDRHTRGTSAVKSDKSKAREVAGMMEDSAGKSVPVEALTDEEVSQLNRTLTDGLGDIRTTLRDIKTRNRSSRPQKIGRIRKMLQDYKDAGHLPQEFSREAELTPYGSPFTVRQTNETRKLLRQKSKAYEAIQGISKPMEDLVTFKSTTRQSSLHELFTKHSSVLTGDFAVKETDNIFGDAVEEYLMDSDLFTHYIKKYKKHSMKRQIKNETIDSLLKADATYLGNKADANRFLRTVHSLIEEAEEWASDPFKSYLNVESDGYTISQEAIDEFMQRYKAAIYDFIDDQATESFRSNLKSLYGAGVNKTQALASETKITSQIQEHLNGGLKQIRNFYPQGPEGDKLLFDVMKKNPEEFKLVQLVPDDKSDSGLRVKEVLINSPEELDQVIQQSDLAEDALQVTGIIDKNTMQGLARRLGQNFKFRPGSVPDTIRKSLLMPMKSMMLGTANFQMINALDIQVKNLIMQEGGVFSPQSVLSDQLTAMQWDRIYSRMHIEASNSISPRFIKSKNPDAWVDAYSSFLKNRHGTLTDKMKRELEISRTVEHFVKHPASATQSREFIRNMQEGVVGRGRRTGAFESAINSVFYGSKLSPMHWNLRAASKMEFTGRLALHINDLKKGLGVNESLTRVLNTHYNYADKTMAEMYTEFVIPFIAYPLRSMMFWEDAFFRNPRQTKFMSTMMINTWGLDELRKDEYENYQASRGHLAIGPYSVQAGMTWTDAASIIQSSDRLPVPVPFTGQAERKMNPAIRAVTDEGLSGQERSQRLPGVSQFSNISDSVSSGDFVNNSSLVNPYNQFTPHPSRQSRHPMMNTPYSYNRGGFRGSRSISNVNYKHIGRHTNR